MSFDSLTLIDLKKIAEEFGVDSPVKITKKALIEILNEEGVTYEIYSHFDKIEKDTNELEKENEPVQANFYLNQSAAQQVEQNKVLVKMERKNASYMVGRYNFTQEHPYVAMPVWDAQYIFDSETGFRLANPGEVQQYYS